MSQYLLPKTPALTRTQMQGEIGAFTLAQVAFLIFVLSVCGLSAKADPRSNPFTQPITLGNPQIGTAAADRSGFRIENGSLFTGKLVYAWDSGVIFFDGSGKGGPGQSYLTLHQFGGNHQPASPIKSDLLASRSLTLPVVISDEVYLYGPQISPDGSKLLFKVGDNPITQWGTYRPVILNLSTNVMHEIDAPIQSIGDMTMRWSPNSRYLAYLQGGFGISFGGYNNAVLHIYDTQTDQDHKVIENEGVKDSFAWTTNDRLLYSVFPPGTPPTRPPADLYEFSLSRGKSVLLRHDAYRPFPAPDGSSIAFLSVQDPSKPAKSKPSAPPVWHFTYDYAVNKYLTLWSRKSNKLRLIRQESRPQFSELRWLPDSRGLALISRRIENQHEDQAELAQYNLSSGSVRFVTRLFYPDIKHIDGYIPLFVPLNFSKDGQWLFYRVAQPYQAVQSDIGYFLRAVHLSDGKVETLSFSPGYGDLDWLPQ